MIHVGYIILLYQKAPDLTDLPPNVINAIRSNPRAAQAVRLILNCIICRSGIKTYTALERDDKKCDAIWYRNLPDVFQCECGNTKINLRYLKENLHSLIGSENTTICTNEVITRMYDEGKLNEIIQSFNDLIEKPT